MSPDSITSCKCTPQCDSVAVQYKCPWSHKDLDPKGAFLQPEIGGAWQNEKFFLQEKSRYFYQIQVQMHVAATRCHMLQCSLRRCASSLSDFG